MSLMIDQLGRQVTLPERPERIVSLVPSQTELLHDLGLEKEVVGITKYCIHPDSWFRSKTRVGGTKKLNRDMIRQLSPDLIIGNKEENEKEDIDWLINSSACGPVWMSDIQSLEKAYQMIEAIGAMTGKTHEAGMLADTIRHGFDRLQKNIISSPLKVLYLIWNNPMMAAGNDTFIHDMLLHCGFKNAIADQQRYPEVTAGMLAQLQPELIFLSSEPYPFSQKHANEIKNSYPGSRIFLVDGEMFSWYGSRLIKAVPYFQKLIEQIDACY